MRLAFNHREMMLSAKIKWLLFDHLYVSNVVNTAESLEMFRDCKVLYKSSTMSAVLDSFLWREQEQ